MENTTQLTQRKREEEVGDVCVIQQAEGVVGAWRNLSPTVRAALEAAGDPKALEEVADLDRTVSELEDTVKGSAIYQREQRYCRHRREFNGLCDGAYDYLPTALQEQFLAHMDAAMALLRTVEVDQKREAA